MADVAHFVVVPADGLDELVFAVGDDAGLGRVVEGAVRDADDIGADDLVFGIAEAFVGGSFHGGVDLFDACLFAEDGDEFGEGAGEGGYALGAAVELTFQFREDDADRFGGAGAVGHDVGGCGAGAAEITLGVGSVLGVLVVGIGVDRGHETGDDPEFIVEYLGHGGQAVGGTGGAADDGFAAVEDIMIDVEDDGFEVAGRGGGDDDAFGAGFEVGFGFFLIGEEAGAFEDDVDVVVFPGDGGWIFLGVYFDFLAVYDNGVFSRFYFFIEAALSAVIFQQVSQNFGTGQVINCHYVYSFHTVDLTERQTPDAAETIDSNFNCAHN